MMAGAATSHRKHNSHSTLTSKAGLKKVRGDQKVRANDPGRSTILKHISWSQHCELTSDIDTRGSKAPLENSSRSCLPPCDLDALSQTKNSTLQTASSGCKLEGLPVNLSQQQSKQRKEQILPLSSNLRPAVSLVPMLPSSEPYRAVELDGVQVPGDKRKSQKQLQVNNVTSSWEDEETRSSPAINNAIKTSRPVMPAVATGEVSPLRINPDVLIVSCRAFDPHPQTTADSYKSKPLSERSGEQSKKNIHSVTSSRDKLYDNGSYAPVTSPVLSPDPASKDSAQACHNMKGREVTKHTDHRSTTSASQHCSSNSRLNPAPSDNNNSPPMCGLNKLIEGLEVRQPTVNIVAGPLNSGYASGRESLVSSSKADRNRANPYSGSSDTLDVSLQANEFTFKANEGINEDRVTAKLASKSQKKTTHLRCPYCFSGHEHPCEYYQIFIRTIM